MAYSPQSRLIKKSCRISLLLLRIQQANNIGKWNQFWNLNFLLPKVHLFLWRLLHNGLGIASRVHHFIEHIDRTSNICGTQEETIEHALLHCNHARACWLLSPLGLRTTNLHGDLQTLLWDWFSSWEKQELTLMANLLWMIWKHRWCSLKEGKILDPKQTVSDALRLKSDLEEVSLNSIQNENLAKYTMGLDQASPMPNGMIQINVDGGIKNGMGAAAMVFRNREGQFICGRTLLEPHNVAAYMEVVAIRMSLLEAHQRGYRSIRLLSDAMGLVNALNKDSVDFQWQARLLVEEIKRIQKTFEICTIHYVARDHNRVADTLVKHAIQCNLSQAWESCPNCILTLVNQELS